MSEQLVRSENVPQLALPVSIFEMNMTYITDVTGIPLDSNRSQDNPHTASIDFELQKCPFSDSPSRFPDGVPHEKPMSGLERKRLNEHYQQNLSAFKYLRDILITAREDEDTARPLSIRETRDLLSGMAFLQHYLVYRAENSLESTGQIPVDIILDSSVARGALVATELFVRNEEYSNIDIDTAIFDPKILVEDAEKAGMMVGEYTVCVVSPKQMDHFFQAIIFGNSIESGLGNIENLVKPYEVQKLVEFGLSMAESLLLILEINETDYSFSEDISPLIEGNISGKAKDTIQAYRMNMNTYFKNLFRANNRASKALGRRPQKKSEFIHAAMDNLMLIGEAVLDGVIN